MRDLPGAERYDWFRDTLINGAIILCLCLIAIGALEWYADYIDKAPPPAELQQVSRPRTAYSSWAEFMKHPTPPVAR